MQEYSCSQGWGGGGADSFTPAHHKKHNKLHMHTHRLTFTLTLTQSRDKWEAELQPTMKEVCLESGLKRMNSLVSLMMLLGRACPATQPVLFLFLCAVFLCFHTAGCLAYYNTNNNDNNEL